TRPGDLVLDPFLGSGTTAAVAKKLGRRWIGLERDPAYAELARRRVAEARPLAEADLLALKPRREAPRIPFGWVVERGLLHPGDRLWDQRRRFSARIRVDGTLVAASHRGEHEGSIHQVGAALQGAPSCNGWTFWHFEPRAGLLQPIDLLRQQLRA